MIDYGISLGAGAFTGYKYAKANNLDLWSGKDLNINKANVQFGNNPNQEYHTFRHTDDLGLNRMDVRNAVESNLQLNSNLIEPGVPFNQTVIVNNLSIQYTAYKLPNGIINVGRIHGIKY